MIRFLYTLFLCCAPVIIFSQGSVNDTISRQGPLGNINLTFDLTDSLDLNVLDSLVNAIDSIVNPVEPESNIFGHNVFEQNNLAVYNPGDIVRIPDTYVLGSGDEIAISIFGISQFDALYIIDKAGFISPDDMTKILLKGMRWGQAQDLLRKRFSYYYRFGSDQFAARVTKPRSVTVNVFGEVERPGSYQLEGTNTAFHALIAAGGPTNRGSVRNIKVIDGSDQRNLDLYDVIRDPQVVFDLYLSDNVIIQVPPITKLIEITGAVSRPLKYELAPNEGLNELIEFAGGLSPSAVKEVIQVYSYVGDKQILSDISYRDLSGKNYLLYDGDIVIIKEVTTTAQEVVVIEGAVEQPGAYAISSTVRVSDLLKKSILKRDARKDMALLVRLNPDSTMRLLELSLTNIIANPKGASDIVLEPLDKVVISSLKSFVDRSTISVSGAVRAPIEYPFDDKVEVSLAQAILLAGGLQPEAKDIGYIIRTDPNNQKIKEHIEVNIKEALLGERGPSNVALKPWDKVLVLNNSTFSDYNTVSISGAVRNRGIFEYHRSLRLKDIITLAGGLKPEASLKLQVYRVNYSQDAISKTTALSVEIDENLNIVAGPPDFEFKPYDEIVVREVPEYQRQSFVTILGEVTYPGKYALLSNNERVASVVRRASGLTEEGFAQGAYIMRLIAGENLQSRNAKRHMVITRLDEAMNNPSSTTNIILESGDIVFIPKTKDVIYIDTRYTMASHLNQSKIDTIAVAYQVGKNAKWYIEKFAGGFSKDADKSNVNVRFANGAMERSKGGLFKKYPIPTSGATIHIGMISHDSSDVREKSSNHNLRKGVIINVGKDGTVSPKSEGPQAPNN